MCGILGISGGDPDLVIKANRFLEHRGPDNHGVFIDKARKILDCLYSIHHHTVISL